MRTAKLTYDISPIENEEWIPVKGYEESYEISNMGRVRSLPRKGSPNVNYLKASSDDSMYKIVGLIKVKGAKSKTTKIHRLVAEHFIPNPFNLPEVNHKLGNKNDNRASELEWCTHQRNIKHAFEIGIKSQIGSKCPRAKIKEQDAIDIRRKFSPLIYTRKMLAREYNISEASVKKILNRTNWSHV